MPTLYYTIERPRHFNVTWHVILCNLDLLTIYFEGLSDEKIKKNGVALGRPPEDAKAVPKIKKQIKKFA
jgi:hypothetical protein